MDTNIGKAFQELKRAADERTAQIRKLRETGLSFAEIAKEMGVSRQRVKQIHDRQTSVNL